MQHNNDVISREQIAKALYINGDENILLKKIKQGDKTALVQLVMLYMPYIIDYIDKKIEHGSYNTTKTELIDTAIQAFIDYVEQYTIVKGAYVYDNLGKYLGTALVPLLKNAEIKSSYNLIWTPENIVKLSKINRLLIEKEKQIMVRVLEYFDIIKQRLKNKDRFTNDYEMHLEVSYFGKPNYGDPMHTYKTDFRYEQSNSKGKPTKQNTIQEIFNSFFYTNDWRDPSDPMLDEPVCYLMHDFINHSRIDNKILNIEMIWFDIHFIDQSCVIRNQIA